MELDNVTEFTVSELSNALRRTLEDAYGYVRVRGEITGLRRAGSGHIYLSLKDAQACLDGVCGAAPRSGCASSPRTGSRWWRSGGSPPIRAARATS